MSIEFFDGNDDIQIKADESKKEEQRKRTFNGLCASEWAELSKSVWNDVSSARQKKHLKHGATYPEKLCERLIRMYSKVGDVVLDPFLGTGTTVVAAIKEQRNAIGIELTDRFFTVANESVEEVVNDQQLSLFDEQSKLGKYKLYQGDCCIILCYKCRVFMSKSSIFNNFVNQICIWRRSNCYLYFFTWNGLENLATIALI